MAAPTSGSAVFGGQNMAAGADAAANTVANTTQAASSAGTYGANTVNGAAVSTPGAAPGTVLNAAAPPPVVSPPPPPPPEPGMFSKVISSPYTAPALISGGMQIGGAYIQGQAQEKQLREQREYEERMAREARDRYNANAGAQLWNTSQPTVATTGTGAASTGAYQYDPLAQAQSLSAQRQAQFDARKRGLVASNMTA